MHKKITFVAFAAILGLAACEGTDAERALIGGAGLATAAAATDNDVATAAAIGIAAGAFCDDVTPQYCQ